jgi:hypothetical protein
VGSYFHCIVFWFKKLYNKLVKKNIYIYIKFSSELQCYYFDELVLIFWVNFYFN